MVVSPLGYAEHGKGLGRLAREQKKDPMWNLEAEDSLT